MRRYGQAFESHEGPQRYYRRLPWGAGTPAKFRGYILSGALAKIACNAHTGRCAEPQERV